MSDHTELLVMKTGKLPMKPSMKQTISWIPVLLLTLFLSHCSTVNQGPITAPFPSASLNQPAPSEAQALWAQAEQDRQKGDLDAAVKKLQGIARSYPHNAIAARAFYQLGNIYLEQGHPKRALQFYDYLLYAYAHWNGVNAAKIDQLHAWWLTGERKKAEQAALSLWQSTALKPAEQVRLSLVMLKLYQQARDIPGAFAWAEAGFARAQNAQQQQAIVQASQSLLQTAGPKAAKELLHKNAGQPLVKRLQAKMAAAPAPVSLPLKPDRIGCLMPLNGPYHKYGSLVLRGLNLAAEEWNNQHPDQPVTLFVKDTQAEPKMAAKSFEELAKQDGVVGVVGPLGVRSATAVAPIANAWQVPVLSLTRQDGDTASGPFLVHVFLNNRALIHTLVQYCRDKMGYTRFATLYPNDRYGQGLAKTFAETVQEMGGKVLASVPYKENSTDFTAPIRKLLEVAKKNSPPSGLNLTPFQALFIPDQIATVSLIAPQLPYNNVVGASLLGTNLWGEGDFVKEGGVYVENAMYATPFFAGSQNPQVQDFCRTYESIYHTKPTYLEAQAYDALMLLLQARAEAASAGTVDRNSVLQDLLQIQNYDGLTGTCSFSPQGGLQRDYLVLQVRDGQTTQVFP